MANCRKDRSGRPPCSPPAKKVDNLISTVDWNGRQIDGDVDDVMPLGDLHAKWLAFGWDVLEMPKATSWPRCSKDHG
jgi:pyruvate dehydrogenase complex dehydrogenase (E1) component